jgi:hypothetical protein
MKTNHWVVASVMSVATLLSLGAQAQDVFAPAARVQNLHLDASRGGFEVVQNDLQLQGMVSQNSASHIRSGNNSIADGAFANSSGLPVVIQNSGSNVLIQNSTIVNVQFQ